NPPWLRSQARLALRRAPRRPSRNERPETTTASRPRPADMPIDPDIAIGAQRPDRTFSWESSDVLLYHLGIGAGSRPGDNLDPAALRYTLDDDNLQVLPSFGIVA